MSIPNSCHGTKTGGAMPHCKAWINHQRARGLSPATVRRRQWTIRVMKNLGFDPLHAAVEDIEEAMISLGSAESRKCFLSDLRMFYRWARRRDLRQDDPTELIDAVRVPARLPTPLTREELSAAGQAADPVTRLMMAFGALAGLRVSEIGRIEGRDIVGDRLVVRNGKGGKDRVVPLHPLLAEQLAKLENHPGPIFGVQGATVSKRIRLVFRRVGLSHHRPHDLRHSFATAAAEQCDGNLTIVAELLGHTDPCTTKRYAAFTPDTAAVVAKLYQPRSGATALANRSA
jgi:integrase/recombinase XerD